MAVTTSMEQLNVEAFQVLSDHNGQTDLYDDDDSSNIWGENETSYGATEDCASDLSVLNREWERRHNQFHTMGYRDGIIAGKEASAQEGFNDGFKEYVYAGYSWGLVRGISSVMSTLPDHLKEKLIGSLQYKERFQKLYESTREISSDNALHIFHSSMMQQNESGNSHASGEDCICCCQQLDSLSKELKFLLHDSAEIKVDTAWRDKRIPLIKRFCD